MYGSVLEEKSSFKMLALTFSSKLDWGPAKTVSKKIGALVRSMKFTSLEVALYLNKSTILPCMEYFCHVWTGAPRCYLELLDMLQKQISRTVGLSLTVSVEPLAYCRNVVSLVFSIGITLIDVHLDWLNWFRFLILKGGLQGCLCQLMLQGCLCQQCLSSNS